MSHEYKICPSCHEEFTLAATECGACEVSLIFADDVEPAEPEDFPPISELACVRVGPLPWTRVLSEGLTEGGIAHRVERETRSAAEGGIDRRTFGGEEVYGTWVEPEKLAAAKLIDRATFSHLEPGEEPAADQREVCPACQEPLSVDAIECSACGLVFG